MANFEKNPLIKLKKYVSDDINKKIIISNNAPLTLYDLLLYMNSYKQGYLQLKDIKNSQYDKQQIYNAIQTQLSAHKNNNRQIGGGNDLIELLNIIVFTKSPIKSLTQFKNVPCSILTSDNIPKAFIENKEKVNKLGFNIDSFQLTRKRIKQGDYGYLLAVIRKYCNEHDLIFKSKNKPVNNVISRVYSIELKE